VIAGCGLLAVATLAMVFWRDLAVEYHVWQLHQDPTRIDRYVSEQPGSVQHAAIRRWASSHAGRAAFLELLIERTCARFGTNLLGDNAPIWGTATVGTPENPIDRFGAVDLLDAAIYRTTDSNGRASVRLSRIGIELNRQTYVELWSHDARGIPPAQFRAIFGLAPGESERQSEASLSSLFAIFDELPVSAPLLLANRTWLEVAIVRRSTLDDRLTEGVHDEGKTRPDSNALIVRLGRAALPRLLEELESGSENERRVAILVLLQRFDGSSHPPWREPLVRAAGRTPRALDDLAAHGFGRPVLRELTKSPDPRTRERAATAIRRRGRKASDIAVDLQPLLDDAEPAVRRAAALALAHCADPDLREATRPRLLPHLLAELESDDPQKRRVAVLLLTRRFDALEEVTSRDRIVHAAARTASVLDHVTSDPDDRPLLRGLLKFRDPIVRERTALALYRKEQWSEDLLRLLDDPEIDVRRAAALALTRCLDPNSGEAARPLIDALTAQDAALSAHAAAALGRLRGLGAADASRALARALCDPRPRVRSAAAVALSRIGDAAEAARPELERVAKEGADRPAAHASRVLEELDAIRAAASAVGGE